MDVCTPVSYARSFPDTAGEQVQVLTQLCLALVDLCVQVTGWHEFLPQLLDKFAQPAHRTALLMLLRFVPEENQSRQLHLGQNRRAQVVAHCGQYIETVVVFVVSFCSQLHQLHVQMTVCEQSWHDEHTVCRALGVFEAWLRETPVPTAMLAKNPLLSHLLSILVGPFNRGTQLLQCNTHQEQCSSKLHESATECVIAALYRLPAPLNDTDPFGILLRDGIVACTPAFDRCAAGEDMDKLHNYAQLFVELADTLMPVIVAQPGLNLGDLQPLQLLVQVVSYHDYSVGYPCACGYRCRCAR